MIGISRRFAAACMATFAALILALSVTPAALAQGKTLTVRFYDDPAGFDPSNIFRIENENIAFNIFSGLTTYDGVTGELVPDLATSWETADNQTWTFKLREGVQWQKGYGEFTAQDVLYSYGRITDPATASPYAAELTGIASIEAPDPYTVIIELEKPNGNFLHTVANYHQGQIVKKEAVEAAGDQVRWQPVGTGPYYLDTLDVTSQIVLKRHEDYYKGPAPVETLVFNIIKDEATATIALRNGEVDLIMRANQEENIQTLRNEGFTMNSVENYGVYLTVVNPEHPALGDPRVRKAISHAIDFDSIHKAISPSLNFAYYSMIPSWMSIYSDDIETYPYDPDRARELLAEAGFPDGFTFKSLGTASTGVSESQQFQIDYLSQVGITMEMELVDTPTFNQRRNAGDFDTAGRLLPAVNPDMILFSFLHPDNIAPNGLNGARYNNPEVTELLEAARAEPDFDKAYKMYARIQRIVSEDFPYIITGGGNVWWPGKPEVTGVHLNYLAQVNFFDVDIAE